MSQHHTHSEEHSLSVEVVTLYHIHYLTTRTKILVPLKYHCTIVKPELEANSSSLANTSKYFATRYTVTTFPVTQQSSVSYQTVSHQMETSQCSQLEAAVRLHIASSTALSHHA